MSNVDIDLVDIEDAFDLLEYCGAGGFDAISAQEGVDIIRVYRTLVNEACFITTSKLPQSGNIGAVSSQLVCHQFRWTASYHKTHLVGYFPSLLIFLLKALRNTRNLTYDCFSTGLLNDAD